MSAANDRAPSTAPDDLRELKSQHKNRNLSLGPGLKTHQNNCTKSTKQPDFNIKKPNYFCMTAAGFSRDQKHRDGCLPFQSGVPCSHTGSPGKKALKD